MKLIKINPVVIAQNPSKYKFGGRQHGDKKQWLHKFIYTLPQNLFDRFNIMVKDPISIANFIIAYYGYQTDWDQYLMIEHWPRNVDDLIVEILSAKADCDGVGVVCASMCHSCGHDEVLLTIGHYGTKDTNQNSHVWCMLDTGGDPLVMELTGDTVVKSFPTLSESQSWMNIKCYWPHVICNERGEYFEISK